MTRLSSKQAPWLGALAAVVLGSAAVWGYLSLDDARDAAARAAGDLATSRAAAARIVAMRGKPTPGGAAVPGIDLRRKIALAIESSEIEGDNLESIDEQAAHRVGATAYEERPTQVLMRNVTLRQVTTFLTTVTVSAPGVRVTALHLTAARDAAATDEWTAEATLTYRVRASAPGTPGLGARVAGD